ncbi:hypothetical protein ENUP19_0100G0020 [Entamoeba nuttalli]|uniref:Sec1 family protein n=2 Tax=Entamoeba nuttalli TaxID=412467 RepID=K2GWS6_ENTNP|nr:Sec1 family protein [Entamoeba nuttalli P19]EKE38232.1 Sec1 family protein [Entamoeba nuttalli P19]|eukprot:XP_008859427.1 Sec1 family protein [Entamoeba nuttalli P19]
MNCIEQLRQLIQELCCVFDERKGCNIKDVILDNTTEKILKSFVSVDELNSYGVLRFRILSNIIINKQPQLDRIGIFILTFNDNNIQLLKNHLHDKVYWKESIIFTQTGVLNENIIMELNIADRYNVINNIECVDINWKYVTPRSFISASNDIDSLTSFIQAHNINPIIITQTSCCQTRTLAIDLKKRLNKKEGEPCILLLLDRSIDGYTPLYISRSMYSLFNEVYGINDSFVNFPQQENKVFQFDFADPFINSNYDVLPEEFINNYCQKLQACSPSQVIRQAIEEMILNPSKEITTKELFNINNFSKRVSTQEQISKIIPIINDAKDEFNKKYSLEELECQQYFHINQKTPREVNQNLSLMMTLYNQKTDNNKNILSERINMKCGPTHQILPLFQLNPLFNDKEFHPLITRIVAEKKMIFNKSFELILGTINEDFNSNKMIIWINGGFTPFEEIELHKTLLKMKSSTEVILGGSQLLNTELYYQWLSNE